MSFDLVIRKHTEYQRPFDLLIKLEGFMQPDVGRV